MAFCSVSDVQAIVDYDSTALNATVVGNLIDMQDAYIKKRTGLDSVSGTTDTNNFKRLSALLTAIEIKNREPQSLAIGDDYREIHSPQGRWFEEAQEIFALYEEKPITTYDQPIGEIDY